jgi:hypothetical protein
LVFWTGFVPIFSCFKHNLSSYIFTWICGWFHHFTDLNSSPKASTLRLAYFEVHENNGASKRNLIFQPVSMLTYIHTFIHTFIHTYLLTYVHTYIRTYVHTYIRTYKHTYIRIYVHTYIVT